MGERVFLPAASDYQAALQNPGFCFSDNELRTVQPERTVLGLPRPISGNFASVFPVRTPDGRRHALKCFTRPAPNQFTRYEAIAAELNRLRPSWAVGMDFHRRGIQVNGGWYPLLRMDWAEAVSLTQWVDRNIGERSRLTAVAERFAGVVRDLEIEGMAHGDLQHGNVLIDSRDDVKLVDYDGMYLPSLAAHIPDEVGHPNYQHPERVSTDYGPTVDRFSAWLVFLSLRALAADPRLWNECNPDHEEYLLLKKADLADPSLSRRVGLLRGHADSRVRELADWLRLAHGSAPGQLSALGQAPPRQPRHTRESTPWPTASASTTVPPWLADRMAAQSSTATAPTARSRTESGSETGGGRRGAATEPAPVHSTQVRSIPPDFPVHRGVRWSSRSVLVFLSSSVVAYTVFPGTLAVAGGAVCALLVLLIVSWAVRVRGQTDLRRSRAEIRRELAESTKALSAARTRLRRTERDLSGVQVKIDGLDKEYESQLRKLGRDQDKRRAAVSRKPEELARARFNLKDEEEDEVRELLAQRQTEYITQRLIQARIQSGQIPGIGAKLVANLYAHGIGCAADIQTVQMFSPGGGNSNAKAFFQLASGDYVNVPGIGPAKAQAIEDWRLMQVSAARANQPYWLDDADRQGIRWRFAQRERDIDNQIRAADMELQQLDSRFSHEKDQVFSAHQAYKQAELATLLPRSSALEYGKAETERDISRFEGMVKVRREWLRSAPKSGLVRYLRKQTFW